jgi:hypothetical protein
MQMLDAVGRLDHNWVAICLAILKVAMFRINAQAPDKLIADTVLVEPVRWGSGSFHGDLLEVTVSRRFAIL